MSSFAAKFSMDNKKVIENLSTRQTCVPELQPGRGDAIPLFKVFMPESVIEPLKAILFSGYVGQGPQVEKFENLLVPHVGCSNVLTLNSGTSALQLALRLAGVGPGDEVISTPMTCVATNQPILAAGADIKWADIDPWTGNIDPRNVEHKITSNTKAILVVHWGGYPCELQVLHRIADQHGLKVIEDACHAFGARYNDQPIGAHSDFVCFSFQAVKEMTTIDGGALTCKSRKDYERGKLLRWYGIDRSQNRKDFRCEEDIVEFGYKFHMNDVTATIGIEQLKYVKHNLQRNQDHARQYNEAFRNVVNIAPLNYQKDRRSSFWLYTLRTTNSSRFFEWMTKAGITVSKVHARNDKHTLFKAYQCALPGVDEFNAEQICLPVGWWLKPQEVEYIIQKVLAFDRAG